MSDPLRSTLNAMALAACCAVVGCRSASGPFVALSSPPEGPPVAVSGDSAPTTGVEQVRFDDPANGPGRGDTSVGVPQRLPPPTVAEEVAPADTPVLSLDAGTPGLVDVIESVRLHFPTVRQAVAGRVIASGEALSASGAFDHKLSGYSNGQPLDYYQNNWHVWKVKRDTTWGGQVGAGYKLGRGSFEPWYKERETNDLGEVSFSLMAPIGRDVLIDANRAELWRAQLERGRVEPVIRGEVIRAVRDGSWAYWSWVAAGANLEIAERVLQLGVQRIDYLQKEVAAQKKARIDITDNQRIIVSREAKRIDAQRKLQQAAVKLSLYLRSPVGQPVVIGPEVTPPPFPEINRPSAEALATDVEFALANRPEMEELSILRQQLNVAYRQACNETRPDIDGGVFMGQDMGNPTSSNDKSRFELEALLTVEVPLERRKAVGKVRQLRGKFAQLRAKTQLTGDKVGAEVQIARAALLAAAERVEQTTEGVRLAEAMREAEQTRFEAQQSTLFNLNLREKQAADAALELVAAQLDFFAALAEYNAALGIEGAALNEVYRDVEP